MKIDKRVIVYQLFPIFAITWVVDSNAIVPRRIDIVIELISKLYKPLRTISS